MVVQTDPLVYLFPSLGKLDVTDASIELKFRIVGLDFIVNAALFFVSYLFFWSFETFRTRLRSKEKVFWCLGFIRAVYGFVGFFFGFWYVALDDALHKDVVNAVTVSSFISLHIFIGFFVFENMALFLSCIIFRNFDPFLTLHHALSLLGGSMVAILGKGHYFSMVGLLLEMTTPFSCFCWMFLKAKKAHLLIWKINQYILVHLFHCRTTVEGYTIYVIYSQWENMRTNMPGVICVFLYLQLSLQFTLLTPYWTYKKMMQLFNPVDWNHPELQAEKAVSESHMNGSAPVSSRHVPRTHEHED